jgi:hypothetical protein
VAVHTNRPVVVDDDHQELVVAPIRDLVDPYAHEPVEGIPCRSVVGVDRPAIAPTVRQAIRINSSAAFLDVSDEPGDLYDEIDPSDV